MELSRNEIKFITITIIDPFCLRYAAETPKKRIFVAIESIFFFFFFFVTTLTEIKNKNCFDSTLKKH